MATREKAPKETHKTRNVLVWSGVFFVAGVLLALAGQYFISKHFVAAPPDVVFAAPPPAESSGTSQTSQPGPWGVLEHSRILLRNYNGAVLEGSAHFKPTRWVFSDYSPAQLKDLLLACELTEDQKTFLLDSKNWEAIPKGYAITPTDQFVLGLGAPTKARLYPVLGADPANFAQSHPFRFPAASFNEKFGDVGLSPEKLRLVRSQVYSNAGSMCLCVDRPLQNAIGTNELNRLVQAFGTVRIWRVTLVVKPDSDIEALVKYWGKGGRDRAIRPLLQSLAREPGGQSMNIAFLLPAFPRLHLYTYPDPVIDPPSLKQDCFYSALNFFDEQPDAQLVEGQAATRALLARYAPTNDKPAFGDLLVLTNPENVAVHVCVYIADDFVFTKDGTGPTQPWVLMKIKDMMADYPSDKPLQMRHMRQKSELSGSAPESGQSALGRQSLQVN